MDPNSGAIEVATPADIAKAEKKVGRKLKPGDPIKTKTGPKVLVSPEVARKLALAENEERRRERERRPKKVKLAKEVQRARARRKRTEMRNRARQNKK